MRITRDVIYDLLPAYFAGEISADTRALVEEYFTTDPEFGRMAQRFRQIHDDTLGDGSAAVGADAERQSFHRARTRLAKRQAAMMWAMGAAFAFMTPVFSMLVNPGEQHPLGALHGLFSHPGIVIGLVFGGVAVATWHSSRRAPEQGPR